MVTKILKKKIAAGVGTGIAAAAAAAYYFYGSKKAKQHRGKASQWAKDMKREVMKEAKGLKHMTADNFGDVVESVVGTYRGLKRVDVGEVRRAANELKANWQKVRSELRDVRTRGVTGRKRVAKKATKKSRKS
jgi:hypothetical protein